MNQAEQDRRIDYIELPATDVAEAKTFYGSCFGWPFTDYGADYASFDDGRTRGGLRKDAAAAAAGGPLVVLYAIELEPMQLKIEQNGGRIVREIFEFPGGRRFHFTDPSGNELAVWSDK